MLRRSSGSPLVPPATEPEVETRCLADYDTALGVAEFDGGVA